MSTSATYTLPTASASVLGGIKVGSGLAITNGVLSNTGSATTDASQLTSGTLADARLSANVPLLDHINTFTNITNLTSATLGVVSLQINNTNATGGGICVGSNQLVSPGGIKTSDIHCPNIPPLTTWYGLISLGEGGWGGGASEFVGSANGTILAINEASGRSNNLADFQVSGTSMFKVTDTGILTTKSASIATSITGPILQANNTSTIGGGIAIGSTTIASAGAGKIAPALSATQTTPATANYGLVSIGGGAWDGSTSGFFAGNANGTTLALNSTAAFSGRILDVQRGGTALLYVDSNGVTVGGNSGTVFAGTLRGSFGLALTSSNSISSQNIVTISSIGNMTASSGTQAGLSITLPLLQTSTAGYTGLLVNATETSTGSGTKLLLDLQASTVSKFSVGNGGALSVTLSTTTTAPSAGAANALPATPQGYATVTINGTSRQIAYY